MSKAFYILILSISIYLPMLGQKSETRISTTDIENFWIAYDSIRSTSESAKQLKFIQELYLDKATDGLKEFIVLRELTTKRHLENIIKYPRFWNSVRIYTLQIQTYKKEIKKIMLRFKKLYPPFREPEVYFTIGCLNSGGTTTKTKILIGSEIAASNNKVDSTELDKWLVDVFKMQSNIVSMVAHEVGHTQQINGDSENDGQSNLLGYCIAEGSCDFISELLLEKPVASPYMQYGKANEKELWKLFKVEMLGQETKNWLYNGNEAPNGNADLGYFIGYKICKSYYENSKDKKTALKEIIELNYTKENVVEFLNKSEYNEKWN